MTDPISLGAIHLAQRDGKGADVNEFGSVDRLVSGTGPEDGAIQMSPS
jgi:hypothetical protein